MMLAIGIGDTILGRICLLCDLSTSRQQVGQPEQQQEGRASSTAADGLSASKDGSYLPLDLLVLVIARLPRSDCAAVRLASSTLRQLTDPTIHSLRIKDLDNRIPNGEGKWRHVTQLDVLIEPGWRRLQDSLHSLPALQHLRLCTHIEEPLSQSFAPFLAGLTRLDLGRVDADLLPSGVSLPKLRAVSFGGCYGRHLRCLASFAPNIEHLYCERMSVVGGEGVELPRCTHFGASHLSVGVVGGAAGTEDAAGAPHTLFPNMKVLYRLPEVSTLTGTSPLLALAPATRFEAIKGHGMLLNTSLKSQMLQMHNLKRLSLHNLLGSGMAAFQGISAFKQLQQLRITGSIHTSAAYTHVHITSLLQELQQLPELQSLALPAELLCCYCSPATGIDCLAALCRSGALKELLFLQLQPAGPTLERPHRRFQGCACPHNDCMMEGLALVQRAVTAAAADLGISSGNYASVWIESGEVWPDHFPWMNDHAAGDSEWGVYGPRDWV